MTAYDSPMMLILLSFLVTISLLFLLRPVALVLGLVDTPNARKQHTGDVPVIGGICIFLGVLVVAITVPELTRNAGVILTMAALMCVVGAIDDRFDLKPTVRLLAHCVAAVVLVLGTGFYVDSVGSLFGFQDVRLGYLAVPLTIIACVALVNAYNMLDGMDGLAGGTSLVGFGALTFIAVSNGLSGSVLVSCAMVGAITAFLLFNLPARFNRPVRTFMGDSGSTVLGFTLAAVSLVLIQPDRASLPPAYVLWFMPLPIFELFSSTIRRMLNGYSPFHADNGHFHHRLLQAGFSVRVIFFIYIMTSAVCALLALEAYFRNVPEGLLFGGFLALFLLWLLFIRFSAHIGARLPRRLRRDLENLPI